MIDISRELLSSPVYPGDPVPEVARVKDIKRGAECDLSRLTLGTHTATHIDAPSHFVSDGVGVSDVALDKCFGTCRVVERRYVSFTDVEELCKNTTRILFKGKVDISTSAASLLAKKLVLIGTEQMSVGDASVHKALLRAGVVILESIDLTDVERGDYILSALPLKIDGADGSPCRAVLITN